MSAIKKAIEELKNGRPIVLVDDATRENEGDLVYPSELITPEILSFMMSECRGLICITLTEERRAQLGLDFQVVHNESVFGTNFAVPFDHIEVQSFGVTASGRAKTIREAANSKTSGKDFISPGFVVPVVARPGGVLRRRGQTEGSIDLVKYAGFYESAVICEILDSKGEIVRDEALNQFCESHNLHMCSIEDIVQYRKGLETNLRLVAKHSFFQTDPLRPYLLPLVEKIKNFSEVEVKVFVDDVDNSEHVALCFGDLTTDDVNEGDVYCRIHSECLTGDVFGSLRCDCGPQLDMAIEKILENGKGVLIYLQQEGRGIGLANKIKAYQLQEQGLDTFQANEQLGFLADARDYRVATQILELLSINKVSLLTNNPHKVQSVEEAGIEVISRIPLQVKPNPDNESYLKAKAAKMGHLLDFK